MIGGQFLKEIRARIQFLMDVGLDYLTLARATGTLSGGEAQRIRLATQIGSGLVGVAYILDEPSIGLHQRDNDKLLATLKHLTGSRRTWRTGCCHRKCTGNHEKSGFYNRSLSQR